MKKTLIILAIVIVIILAVLAAVHFLPYWATILSCGTFVVGAVGGYLAKKYIK